MASTSHGIVLIIEDDPRTAELIATNGGKHPQDLQRRLFGKDSRAFQ